MKIILTTILTLIIFLSTSAFSQSQLLYKTIGDFELVNGDTIKDCKIGYRTFGNVNVDSSNIVIYCTWFGGSSEGIASLIEKNNFVDTTAFFIISVDALGNGISSSPSNYGNVDFPEITIADMVNSQYKLLTEQLSIRKLYGAIGGSMGSMQVLQWAVQYPEFIDKIVAYVPSPKLTSADLMWINIQMSLIETGMNHNVPREEVKRISDMITSFTARTPDYFTENIKSEDFNEYFKKFTGELNPIFTFENYLCQAKAMIKHDISINYDYSFEKVADQIKSELLFIISQTDMMVSPSESSKLAELEKSKVVVLNNNCGHLAVSCEFERCKEEIKKFFEQ